MTVTIIPCRISEANLFVANFHRHNKPSPVSLFSVGASDGTNMVGVAIVGLPVSRVLMADGTTLECTRCCVIDGAPKGTCSALYGAAWRATKALGYRRLVTYTLQSESGASLRGAGFRVVAELKPRSDSSQWTSRPGREWQSVVGQAKIRWEMTATKGATGE
jgi:hypothetical protein